MGNKLDQTSASPPNDDSGNASRGDDAADARLTNLDRLRRTGSLAAARKVASFIAHELGTPLNVIEARASMVASGEVTGQAAQDSARKIAEQAARMTKIIREFLNLARARPPRADRVDLFAVASSAAVLAALSSGPRNVSVDLDPESEAAVVTGDADELLYVALGLLINGVHATPPGGTVTLAARCKRRASVLDPNGPPMLFATLSVRDAGPGLSKDSIALLWKPFFCAKINDSDGLDLPMAEHIVKDHGGWIEVESDVGSGSCFTVYLPRGDG